MTHTMKYFHMSWAAACLAALALVLAGCGSDDDPIPAKVAPENAGTFVDTRDGHVYHWVKYGGLDWMTDNFAYDIHDANKCNIYQPDYDFYNETNTENLPKYGRLYTLDGALAACPDGWRIPTDADWQSLERALGMSAGDAAAMDWRGHVAHSMFTMKGDTCALNLLLGGYFDSYWGMGTSKWRHMGTYGYYWTATIDSAKAGQYYFFRKVAYNRNAVYRQSMEPSTYMLSVRYVRDDH